MLLGGSDDVMLREECQGSVSGVNREARKRICAGGSQQRRQSNGIGVVKVEKLVISGEWEMGVEMPGWKENTGG